MDEEGRIRTLVMGVVREALRESGARGLILSGVPGAESRLLARWCRKEGVPLEEPDEDLADRMIRSLKGGPEPGAGDRITAEVRRALTRVRALEEGLIPVSTLNRTALLLSATFPPEPLHPLADVPGTTVLELTGDCTLPAEFRDLKTHPDRLRAVEDHLETIRRRRSRAERGDQLEPELRRRVEEAVKAGSWWRRAPPLVPKLGPGTWGVDLDL